ncbi:MAG: cytochrome b5 domain-containing protein [Eubacteriales bacterium]|jgi:membrane-associated progesterone receptor component|nr:cytochrome b5 domain-containing protein [Eubacteriales bacterium]
MNDREIFINMIDDNLNEMSDTIDCLYTTSNFRVKNKLLNRLRKSMSNISMLTQGLRNDTSMNNPQPSSDRLFTLDELSRYNGRNGNPAYVAINDIVYDVTGNAAWGGATHFGLTAGTDVTSPFASCHAGQPILSKLKVVGKIT